jgi:DNA-binding response OmpR family regulator
MKKIMIVDDDPDIVFLVEAILKKKGFEVVGATGGRECLEILESYRPDLILLDIMMPKMNGWDVLKHIRERKDLKKVYVAMLTAKGLTVEALQDKHLSSLVDYIQKPFSVDSLTERVEGILSIIVDVESKRGILDSHGENLSEEYEELKKSIKLQENLIQNIKNLGIEGDVEEEVVDVLLDCSNKLISLHSKRLNDIEDRLKEG